MENDEALNAGLGRVVDTQRKSDALVLYRSNFDAGFDGWTDHWDGYRPWPIVSLTEQMQYTGRRSLMLSTGEEANPVAGDPATAPAVFKRFARHDEYRFHAFSGYFALGVGGYSGTWSTFQLMIDTQGWDNAVRSFFKVQCAISPSPDYTRWQIRGDGGDADFKNIPGSSHLFVGNNDNKQNFQYVRMTVDLHANGGLGGYHSLQVGRGAPANVFDLRGLGGGSSLEAPQWNGSDLITDFRGGFNVGLSVMRNTALVGGCQLFADDLTYTVSNSNAA